MTSPDWLSSEAPFDVVRRGFAPDQVTAHIEKLEYDLRIATANQDATAARIDELSAQLSDALGEADELRAELDRYAARPVTEESLSEVLRRKVSIAEAEAAEIRAQAERDATRIRNELATAREGQDEARASFHMEQESARTALAQQVKSELDRADEQAETIIADARAEAERIVRDAQATADELARQAEHDRAQVEEDFTLAMGARRVEARQAITDAEHEAKEEADRHIARAHDYAAEVVKSVTAHANSLVERATAEAHYRVAEAAAAVTAARTARSDILRQIDELAARLDGIRHSVGTAREGLDPLPSEDHLPDPDRFSIDPSAHPVAGGVTDTSIDGWQAPPLPDDLANYPTTEVPDVGSPGLDRPAPTTDDGDGVTDVTDLAG